MYGLLTWEVLYLGLERQIQIIHVGSEHESTSIKFGVLELEATFIFYKVPFSRAKCPLVDYATHLHQLVRVWVRI